MASRKQRKEKERSMQKKQKALLKILLTYSGNLSVLTSKRTHCIVVGHASTEFHCDQKITDPILNTTEQHFQMSLNSVFSFSLSCFVFEIFRLSLYANLVSLDVIYSRTISYIYKMMNIFGCNGQNLFKLCISVVIR